MAVGAPHYQGARRRGGRLQACQGGTLRRTWVVRRQGTEAEAQEQEQEQERHMEGTRRRWRLDLRLDRLRLCRLVQLRTDMDQQRRAHRLLSRLVVPRVQPELERERGLVHLQGSTRAGCR